jgi:hypothetical protein
MGCKYTSWPKASQMLPYYPKQTFKKKKKKKTQLPQFEVRNHPGINARRC